MPKLFDSMWWSGFNAPEGKRTVFERVILFVTDRLLILQF
jgi:hypothetical protein